MNAVIRGTVTSCVLLLNLLAYRVTHNFPSSNSLSVKGIGPKGTCILYTRYLLLRCFLSMPPSTGANCQLLEERGRMTLDTLLNLSTLTLFICKVGMVRVS